MNSVNDIIKQDFSRWCEISKRKYGFKSFLYFMKFPEYRKLLSFRLKQGNFIYKILYVFLSFSSIHHNLYFSGKIGEGLFLHHAFATIINCKSIGKNCWINQQVTIGNSGKGIPTIGDNVRFSCGCKVLGPITIGDDVIIGANAVVVKDVPSHSIVVGIPAKVIKTRKDMDSDWQCC